MVRGATRDQPRPRAQGGGVEVEEGGGQNGRLHAGWEGSGGRRPMARGQARWVNNQVDGR